MPIQTRDFSGNSIIENQAAALEWLRDGRVSVEGMASGFSPAQAQAAYDGLLAKSLAAPTALFDWRLK
jgi:hypothetical protein